MEGQTSEKKPSHLQQRPYRITSNFHNDLIFPFFNDLFHMAKYSIHKKKISGIVCYKKIFKLKKILTEKKCSQQKNNIYGILINPLYIFQAADEFHTVTIKLIIIFKHINSAYMCHRLP